MKRDSGKYAWVICGACLVLLFCTLGLPFNVFSVFLPFLIEANGLSKMQGSFTVTFVTLMSFLGLTFVGKLIDRFGIRKCMAIAFASLTLGQLAYAFAPNVWVIYLGAALSGFSYAAGGMVPMTILINRWFYRHRNVALGVAACGSGVATIIMSPIATWLLTHYGLRIAFLAEAAGIAAAGVLVYLLVDDYPENKGFLPYGAGGGQDAKKQKDFACREMSGKEKAVLLAAYFLLGTVLYPVAAHTSVHLTVFGYPAELIAGVLSLYGIALTAAKLLCGEVIDRIGVFVSNMFFYSILICGLILFALSGKGVPFLYAGAMMLAAGNAVGSVGMAAFSEGVSTERPTKRTCGASRPFIRWAA